MRNEREVSQARVSIMGFSKNSSTTAEFVRAACWPDTLKDILESYLATAGRNQTQLGACLKGILTPDYYPSFASAVFDLIKGNTTSLVSPRRFAEIRMLVENFDMFETHFLERYRFSAKKWNQPMTSKLRLHIAGMRETLATFVIAHKTRFDLDSAMTGVSVVSELFQSDLLKKALLESLPVAQRDTRHIAKLIEALWGVTIGNMDPAEVVQQLDETTFSYLASCNTKFGVITKTLGRSLSQLGYAPEDIGEVLGELEVAIEFLIATVESPEEPNEEEVLAVVPQPDAVLADNIAESGVIAANMIGSKTDVVSEAIEPTTVSSALVSCGSTRPVERPADAVRWLGGRTSGIGLNMTQDRAQEQGQKYWDCIRACMRHDHGLLMRTWARLDVVLFTTMHPHTKRNLLHFAIEAGAIKISRLVAREFPNAWLACDIEGRTPLERIMFQLPLRRGFFLELLRLMPNTQEFTQALKVLETRLISILPNIKNEERRADFDFLLDHISVWLVWDTHGINASPPVLASKPVLPTHTQVSVMPTKLADQVFDAIMVVGHNQRQNLRDIGLTETQINDIFLWLANQGLAEVDFTRWVSHATIDPDDTDMRKLALNKPRILAYLIQMKLA